MTIKEIMESVKPGSTVWEDVNRLTVPELVAINTGSVYWVYDIQTELNDHPAPLRPITRFIFDMDIYAAEQFKKLGCERYIPTGREDEGYNFIVLRNGVKLRLSKFPATVVNTLLCIKVLLDAGDLSEDDILTTFLNRINSFIAHEYAIGIDDDQFGEALGTIEDSFYKLTETSEN